MNKWKHEKLSKLCTRIGDGLHGTPQYSDNSDIYFINGNNIKNGIIEINDNTKKVDIEEFEKNYIPLNEKTLLLSINGTLGSLAFYNNEKVMLGKSAAYLNFKTEINKFYYYYFQLDNVQQYFYNVATGSTIKNLSLKSIQDYEVPVPEKHEWENISNVLSSLDSKIALNNRINAELEAMAKTVYDYWFVQFNFPAPSLSGRAVEGLPYKSSGGKMVWSEELKREVPEGWEMGELKDIANITMGQSPAGESYNEDGNGMVFYQGCTDFGTRFPTIRKYTSEPTRFARQGDILLSVRAPVGTLNIAKEDCCIGRGLAALNSKDNCIAFLFGVMVNLKQIFDRRNADGTTFGSITKDDLFSLKVLKPSVEVLEMYDKLINPCFEKQNLIAQENQQLSSLRDWLLPMLMNGQVRVGAQAYVEMEEGDGLMAAEESVGYDINNSIKSDKKWTIGNRTILAGYIIKRFNCKGFGRVMLMKLLFLVEYICKIDFESHYVVNVAGPYDDLIREIELKLRTYKLFNAKQEKFGNQVSYEDMGGSDIVESLFTESFCQEADQINSILDKFLNSKWDQCEIVATLYAVWNNRILNNYQINDMVLKQDFLNWDPQKVKYENRLDDMLVWMRKNDIVPIGWGKLIEK